MTQTVFPCLTFHDAKASIAWLEPVLSAERLALCEDDADGVRHAEVRIGGSTITCGDERGVTATPPDGNRWAIGTHAGAA